MRTIRYVQVYLWGLAAVAGCGTAERPMAPDSPPTTVTAPSDNQADPAPANSSATGSRGTDADNTAVNDRDRSDSVKTPIDQNENQRDIDITAEIRKRIVDTKMSINAQNVKVITQNGRVTLRGPVKSADEKTRIQEIATAVAGDGNVDNQIEVEANP